MENTTPHQAMKAPSPEDLKALVEQMQQSRRLEMLRKLNITYTYHKPSAAQIPIYEDIRSKAKEFALYLLNNVPAGRELEIAQTRLEECVMWANKGVACDLQSIVANAEAEEAKQNG